MATVNKKLALILASSLAAAAAPLWLLAPEGTALGQQKSSVEEAKRRMEKAQALFAQGKFDEARVEFEAAHAAQPYSAFLYNAALASQKAGDAKHAILHYSEFLAAEPNAPDTADIKLTIDKLKEQLASEEAAAAAAADAGDAGGDSDAGGDAGAPAAPVVVVAPITGQMRSLVLVDSDPSGAPFSIYQRTDPGASSYQEGGENKGWKRIAAGVRTPHDLALNIGHYHVVIDAFKDYHRSETDIDLEPGHVYNFKANLSQGSFFGFLKVGSKVEGAKIFVDDPPPHKQAPWGRTPNGGPVESGEHTIWVEAPGYEPLTKKFKVDHGETAEVTADLERVPYGFLKIDGNAPDVEVQVDGKAQGVYNPGAGAIRLRLPGGPHTVVLDPSGKKTIKTQVDVPRGQELSIHGSFIDSPPRSRAIITGLLAGGFAAGGVVLYNQAQKTPDGDSSKDLYTGLSYAGFIGGGVLAAATVFLLFYDPSPDSMLKTDKAIDLVEGKDKEAKIRLRGVAPFAAPGGGGVGFTGVF